MQRDTEALRATADGSAEMALDMVGQAQDPNATLAALGALRRDGRLVLMGSMTAALPVSYMQMMTNDLEIIHVRTWADLRRGELRRSFRLEANAT